MKSALLIISIFFLQKNIFSQRITYSEPGNTDSITLNLEVIGKVKNNYFVYDHTIGKQMLDVYDNKMKLKKASELTFLHAKKMLYLNFISYPDFCLAVFQAVEKGMVYCKLAKIDDEGNLVEIKSIDSVRYGLFRGGELYSVSVSENKRYILFNRPLLGLKDSALQLDQVTMDANFTIIKNEHYFIPFVWNKQFLSNTDIDNSGNVIFFSWKLEKGRKTAITFYKSPADGSDLLVRDVIIDKYEPNMPQMKINNSLNAYYFISFYKHPHQGDAVGLISIILHADLSDYTAPRITPFNRDEKKLARDGASTYLSIDDYSLSDIFLKNDGGFVATASLNRNFRHSKRDPDPEGNNMRSPYVESNTNGNPDYSYYNYVNDTRTITTNSGAPLDPSLYVSNNFPSLPASSSPGTSNYSSSLSYPNANVLTFSFDNNNRVFATNSLKNQLPTAFLAFYHVSIVDSELVFVYNNIDKNGMVTLRAFSLFSDGSTILKPQFKNWSGDYIYAPERAKQVDEKTIIIPCKKDERILMAKIAFE